MAKTKGNSSIKAKERLQYKKEYMETFQNIKDLDLLILKAHVLIEHELKTCIAFRLSLSDDETLIFEDKIKNLPFFHVANIALAGNDNKQLLSSVLKLNDVRTEIAHKMNPATNEEKLSDFNQSVWQGEQFPNLHIATLTFLANIWGRIVKIYIDGKHGDGTFESIMP